MLHRDWSAPLIGPIVRQPSSRERVRDRRKRVIALGKLLHERVVLAGELLVVVADFSDDAVRAGTVGALRLVLAETAERRSQVSDIGGSATRRDKLRDEPLMVRVFAHEVHGGQVELALARRAARDLENPRRVRIRQLLDLFPLLGRFGSVRRDEGLVLHSSRMSASVSEP